MLKQEQLKARNSHIGGSDCASAMGLSSYKSMVTLWLEKTGRMLPDDLTDNERVQMGIEMEDYIAQMYAKRHPGHKVWHKDDESEFNRDYPWMIGHYDRVATDENGVDYVIEIKNVGEFQRKDWDDLSKIPIEYECQCRFYRILSGCDYVVLVALVGGQHYVEHTYYKDEELEATIIEKTKEFYGYLQKDEQPPILITDANDSTSKSLTAYYDEQGIVEERIEITDPEIWDSLRTLEMIKQEIKVLEDNKSFHEAKLRESMKCSTTAEIGDYWVNWKPQVTNRIDTKKLKAEYPEIAEKLTNQSISRVLRINKKKEL